MSLFTEEQEKYMKHELKLRLHEERFKTIKDSIDDLTSSMRHLDGKLDSQFKWIIGMFASSVILPVLLHFVKAI